MKIVPGDVDLEDDVSSFLLEVGWPEESTGFAGTTWFVAMDDQGHEVAGMTYGNPACVEDFLPQDSLPDPAFWIDLVVVNRPGLRLGTCLLHALVKAVAAQHRSILLSIDQERNGVGDREKFARECGFIQLRFGPESVWGAKTEDVVAAVAMRLANRPPCP